MASSEAAYTASTAHISGSSAASGGPDGVSAFLSSLQQPSTMPGCVPNVPQTPACEEYLGQRTPLKRSRWFDDTLMALMDCAVEAMVAHERLTPVPASHANNVRYESNNEADAEAAVPAFMIDTLAGDCTPRHHLAAKDAEFLLSTPCSQSVKRVCTAPAPNRPEALYTPSTPRRSSTSINPFAWSPEDNTFPTPGDASRPFWLPSTPSGALFSSQTSPAILATSHSSPLRMNSGAFNLPTPDRSAAQLPRRCLLTALSAADELAPSRAPGAANKPGAAPTLALAPSVFVPAYSVTTSVATPRQASPFIEEPTMPLLLGAIRAPRPAVPVDDQLGFPASVTNTTAVTPTSRPLATMPPPLDARRPAAPRSAPLKDVDAAAAAMTQPSGAPAGMTVSGDVSLDSFLKPGLRLKAPRPTLDANCMRSPQEFFVLTPALRV